MSRVEFGTAPPPTRVRTSRAKRAKKRSDEERKIEELLGQLRKVDDRLRELLRRKFESKPELQKELGIAEPPSNLKH
jgi:hypothetical protein